MSNEYEFEDVTTDAAIATYQASTPIFEGLIKEIRELSRKKPDATMSASKVKIVNRVLNDLLNILKAEPTGKYLEILNDESLPQVSDAVLTMVQFESALEAFKSKYRQYVDDERHWITQENLDAWNADSQEEDSEN
ncbi:MAG: hypothetical protein E8D46_05455 [Nitrospira sp.]|nr:MAG: hypothetical protein E8D46_05455 [Nitrospira sp.]